MGKIYITKPNNFEDIEELIIVKDDEVLEVFLKYTELYFYDTCSLQCHSKSNNRDKIIEYIKVNNGAIVITQTVLTELSGNNGDIEDNVVSYLRVIRDTGISIVLFKEESLLYILRECINQTYDECNKDLAYAIGEVSSATKGTVEKIDTAIEFKKNIFKNKSNSKNKFKEFFSYALSQKTSGDNMGEEMMLICFILLSKVQVIDKVIFLSNDLKSRGAICSISNYTKKRYSREPYQLTSSTLFYKLVKSQIVKTPEELKEMMEKSISKNNINLYYTDKYSINIEEASLTINDYVTKVFNEAEFKVLY